MNVERFHAKSLDEQLYEHLCKEWKAGRMPDLLPGEYRFAKELGVSRPVLRLALERLVANGIIQKNFGVRSHVLKRRTPQTHSATPIVIVIVWNSDKHSDSLQTALQPSLELALTREAIAFVSYRVSESQKRTGVSFLKRIRKEHSDASYVLLGTSKEMQEYLVRERVKTLLLGSAHEGIDLPSIDFDYTAIGRHAAALLYRLGHRKVGLLLPPEPRAGDRLSINGFLKSWRGDPDGVQFFSAISIQSRSSIKSTAFFSLRIADTIRLLCSLQKNGIRVPEDVSILSRDFHETFRNTVPKLTMYGTNTVILLRNIVHAIKKLGTETSSKIVSRHVLAEILPDGESLARVTHGE